VSDGEVSSFIGFTVTTCSRVIMTCKPHPPDQQEKKFTQQTDKQTEKRSSSHTTMLITLMISQPRFLEVTCANVCLFVCVHLYTHTHTHSHAHTRSLAFYLCLTRLSLSRCLGECQTCRYANEDVRRDTLQHAATRCNAWQHTMTQCNTL